VKANIQSLWVYDLQNDFFKRPPEKTVLTSKQTTGYLIEDLIY
jgi:hypothetical protein